MVYSILSILWKKTVILNTLGRIARSYELYIRREGEIVLIWNEFSFCSYMGPNQVRIMDQMPSRLSVSPQVSLIKTDTYEGIGQRLIGFCVYVSVVVRRFATGDVFRLFAVNIFNLSRPRLIKWANLWKPLLLL